MVGRPAEEVLDANDLLDVYRGGVAEQFVAQKLTASFGAEEPHWWKRAKSLNR